MIKGLKNWFIITRVCHIRARYTARICKEFVRQNPRDWTFSSLYREVCYIRGVLYRDSAALLFTFATNRTYSIISRPRL